MTYERHGVVHDLKTHARTNFVELYEQPLLDKLKHWLFHHTACVLPWKAVDKFDSLTLEKLHRRTCNDDCVDFVSVHDPKDVVKSCGRMPLSNYFDCVCYDLEHKNNTQIRRS